MRSIAVKLWVAMVLLIALVLGILGLVQTRAVEASYYRIEARRMVAEAKELADLLVAGVSPQAVGERVAFLSQVFRANVLIVDAAGRVQHWCGGGRWGQIRHGMSVNGEDVQAVLGGETVLRQGEHPLFQDVRMLWVGVPVRAGDRVEGGVFVYAPLASLAARVRGLVVVLAAALLGGVALAGVLSFFVARHFSRRLVAMEQVARAMATGNYAARVALRGEDEVTRLGESLNKLARELEKQVAAMERVNQTRRDFVAAVSHELRTPLSVIQGYTEAILDGMVTDEEQQGYLNAIREEAERLRRLTDELLDLRRLETGALTVRREKVHLGEVAARAAARFKAQAAASGIDFQTAVSSAPPVSGDPDRLEQVVVNLLDNAFRFTPAGKSVTLRVAPVPEGVALSVRDTGPGIAPEELPHVWEKFYRGDRARTRDAGGSGLGLAIVKQIVELHGGRVEVTSRPGEGSTFTVVLPVAPGGETGGW
ncbi:MAG: ATP-binding protein [Thermoanaerobacteraceae bacterium]|nr:ATP-binding protein [Thermoanaerobacteraceae bacterium]